MSITINGATNTLTAASGLAIAGNTAVTGTLSVTGAMTSGVGVVADKDGSDSVGSGAYFELNNDAGSRAHILQLGASNDLAFWNYNGATWRKTLTMANSTGTLTFQPDGANTVLSATTTGLAVTGTLSATGITSVTDTTDATSTTAASLKTAGGLAVAKKLYVGDNIVMASGKGIDFSATANGSGTTSSEVLSDYEEGTWTPVLTYATPGTLSVTQANYGHYTKIGRQVTVQATVRLSAFTKGTASGALQITGLPFTVLSDEQATIVPIATYDAPFTTQPCASASVGGTTIVLLRLVNNSAWVALDDPDANSQYAIQLTYHV